MEIQQRILDLLKSDDLEMKNLGLSILLTEDFTVDEIDVILRENIKDPFYYKYDMDVFSGQRSITISRKDLSFSQGLFAQLHSSYTHTYSPKEFKLGILKEVIKDYLNNK